MKALFYCTRAICSLSCSLWSAAQQLVLYSLKYISITKHLAACVLKFTNTAKSFASCALRLASTAKSFAACILKPASVAKQLGVKTLHYAGAIKHLLHKSLQRMHARVRAARQGFSLVELMIVVAIIGVLTAIAIPNFQAFQRRSRQSEAKSALTALYTAEQTFHSSWEVYTGSLVPAGWTPSGQFRYQVGFNDGEDGFCGTPANMIMSGNMINCGPAPGREYTGVEINPTEVNIYDLCGDMVGVDTAINGATVRCNFTADVAGNITAGAVDAMGMITTLADPTMGEVSAVVTVNDFQAAAIGDLLGEGMEGDYDTWSIDEEKNLTHEHNGAEF